jgi:hypothetical protein
MSCRTSGCICSTRGYAQAWCIVRTITGSSKGRWLLLNVRLSMMRSNACGKGLLCVVSSGRSQPCPVCAWGGDCIGVRLLALAASPAGPQHSWVSARAHHPHALHMHATVLGRASYVDNRSVRRELAGCGGACMDVGSLSCIRLAVLSLLACWVALCFTCFSISFPAGYHVLRLIPIHVQHMIISQQRSKECWLCVQQKHMQPDWCCHWQPCCPCDELSLL